MTVTSRDKKALLALAVAGLIYAVLQYTGVADPSVSAAAGSKGADSVELAQQRAARLRQIAALVPAREAVAKQVSSDLADREKGMIRADTAAQAQAAVGEIAVRVGKANQIDVRGGDFPAPKTFSEYGMVYTTVTFECHIEQLVNFLADLSHQPELVVPSEERITAVQPKQKMVSVRMVLAGVTPKKLIPEKKGFGAF
jgi:hypothetical protein